MNKVYTYYITLFVAFVLTACSSTSSLNDGEQLYTGLKPIQYSSDGDIPTAHAIDTRTEIEAALACAPNGALFGSSYYRTPFPYGLWIYNAFSGSDDVVSKWLTKTLGKAPVLLGDVNPELRASVAENVLANNGFFQGTVDYDIIEGKKGKAHNDTVPRVLTGKIAYKVNMGPLYTLDSIAYTGFTADEMQLISNSKSLLKRGDAFSVSNLDAERQRLYTLFRDSGYYYYQPSYTTYYADTVQIPQHVQLQLHLLDSVPSNVHRRWVIGRTVCHIRRQIMEQLTDSVTRRSLAVCYAGKKSPIRTRVIMQDIRLRPRQMFSQTSLEESLSRLTSKGIYQSVDISFVPNGTDKDGNGILDMTIDCILDKPYDFSLEANYTHKTSGRSGPGVGMGFAKRNAFRGGELLSFNVNGSADYQMGKGSGEDATSYDLSFDATLSMPRLLLPNAIRSKRRFHWYATPSTTLRAAIETINRSGFYRRNIASAEINYMFQPTATVRHTFSPLTLDYSYLASSSEAYRAKSTVYTQLSSKDVFIPKMRYTFSYTSSSSVRNPITLNLTATEAGNIVNLAKSGFGKRWNEEGKKLFKTEFSQFVKFEAEWTKQWRLSEHSTALAHAMGGMLLAYGNSSEGPFSERYFVGGANDLRGFATRSVGPGRYYVDDKDVRYLTSNGDIKMMFNLEYRPRLFGSLYGALFLDAGNVWDRHGDDKAFRLNHFAKDLAVDAGVGVRYDMDIFVLRLDWGVIVHSPYSTATHGYFNTPSFSQAQCLNFAIGYPF